MKTLTVTEDFTKEFNEIINSFKNDEVLVGIPEENSTRDGNEPINNATLLAIANFGSPANNIPAWPIMAIGIRNAQDDIAEQYKIALKNAFSKGLSALGTYYERIGIIASNSVKKVINTQLGVPPDKPEESTLASRKSKGFKGSKYWLVTGQMRNAITYVVKGGK